MAISQAKKLELITKHAKNYTTKQNGSSPILEGVHYSADGSVVATNRHTLLRIGGAHNFTEEFTSHTKTGANIDGNYPDTSRLIPESCPTEITLSSENIAELIARVKAALTISKLAGDRTNLARLTLVGANLTLSVNSASDPYVEFKAGIAAEIAGPDADIAFNAQYLLDALNVLKDAGSIIASIGISGPHNPIVVRDADNAIDIIALPYRIPKEAV